MTFRQLTQNLYVDLCVYMLCFLVLFSFGTSFSALIILPYGVWEYYRGYYACEKTMNKIKARIE